MTQIGELYRSDDWKNEKHVPVIDFPGNLQSGNPFAVVVTVGKEIPHPNKSEHFIVWIALYFKPEGESKVYEMGRMQFSAHGATTDGPNSVVLHTDPQAVFQVSLDKPGTFLATSYCNIHGLWESEREVAF